MDFDPQPLSTRLKFATLAILVFLFLLVAPAKWFGIGKQTYEKNEALPTQIELATQNINDDSDSDGIPNWKESLLGTNPKAKDAKPFETTTKTPLTTENSKVDSRLADPNNLTSQYIKNTVGIASYVQQQNLTQGDVLNSVSNGVADQVASLSQSKTYTEKDLIISKDESVTALKKYGNTVIIVFLAGFHDIDAPNVLTPLQEYEKNNDPAKLKIYNSKATILAKMITDILAIPVPDSAVNLHLYLLNTSEQYKTMLINFGAVQDDPMRALIGVKTYKEVTISLGTIITSYADYFMKKNVIFTSKDNGYLFTKVILNK